MFTRQKIAVLAVVAALATPAAAGAQESRFNYLEAGIVGGFVNDVETSGTLAGGGGPFEFETDADNGGFIGGAWQVSENFHLFGEYASMGQELEVSDGIATATGGFDVVRWRLGVGYSRPISDRTVFYGRLSADGLEFKDVQVDGFSIDTDADESGAGAEVGMIWAATPTIDLQGHLRYTSVGGVADGGSDAFESDVLVGLNGRWSVRPNIALVAGYEYGKITTLNFGVRFSF
ncbi:MAG: outer membrane beta-barrel protein [Caulobacteraceae bacterium]|nr:outer membrane beta-barrel protein [Caulobacteraceae bacterium]